VSWLEDLVVRAGEPAVAALIALESIVPPIPSEVVLPFAGFQAARGVLDLGAAWIAATLGSLAGAWVLYGLGAAIGFERLHALASRRWFVLLSVRDLERGTAFFSRHGGKIVLVGRCIPLVRSVVSVPAGIQRMNPARFTAYTTVGSAIWNAVFLGAGWQLGDRSDVVEGWIRPVALAVSVLAAVVATVLAVRAVADRRGAHDCP
jgi:membrane protein DedA with SNARE-associated domain